MVEYERRLLSKAIHSGQLDKLIGLGIEESHFGDEMVKSVWQFVIEHTVKYNSPPSIDAIVENNSHFVPTITSDSLEYLIDKFYEGTKRRLTIEYLRTVAEAVDNPDLGDPEEMMLDAARKLSQAVPSGEVGRYSDMDKRIEQYRQDKTTGKKRGITSGVPTLDDITEGIQPHEMVVISGYSGSGKSTFLQYMLYKARQIDKVTPMMISLEMGKEALYRKWDVMATNFEYRKLKKFELSSDEEEKWRNEAHKARHADTDIIVLDKLGRCTIEKVCSEINRYKPDIVGIDYVSLMDTPKHAGTQIWERVTYITNNLKYIARSLNIPIIAVAQTNSSDPASLDNIAHSKSVVRDADIVLGLYQDQEMRDNKQMQLRVNKNRDGELKNIDMFWDMHHMQFEEWSPKHMFTKDEVINED